MQTVQTPVTPEGARLHYADVAHSRLLMDADAAMPLSRTSFDALRAIAERNHTVEVPQIREALQTLSQR